LFYELIPHRTPGRGLVVNVLLEIQLQMHSSLLKWAYEVGGVIVTIKKLEQSSSRDVMAGILPMTVPVTARAQLFAWHWGY
jgi:hypothetical protein